MQTRQQEERTMQREEATAKDFGRERSGFFRVRAKVKDQEKSTKEKSDSFWFLNGRV